MHIESLKPLHGWRAFAGEVGIVVLGVLLALAAGQLAEEWNWRQKAADARSGIEKELAMDAGVFDERALFSTCVQTNAKQLAMVLRNARKTGTLPDIRNIPHATTRPMVSAAWTAANADGTAAHLSPKLRETGGIVYPMINDFMPRLREENELWAEVALAKEAPGPISDAMLTELSAALARATFQSHLNDVIAGQQLALIRSLGIKPDYTFPVDPGATRADLMRLNRLYGCKPLLIDGKPAPPIG